MGKRRLTGSGPFSDAWYANLSLCVAWVCSDLGEQSDTESDVVLRMQIKRRRNAKNSVCRVSATKGFASSRQPDTLPAGR